ncbi:MAG: DEAD/DEAH box helicase family protein, partial [Planctomycetaceae bacterium]
PPLSAARPQPPLAVRLILTDELPGSPASFHPKAWCIHESPSSGPAAAAEPQQAAPGTCLVVGSSNLSRAALLTGIEWNLVTSASAAPAVAQRFTTAFTELWTVARPLAPALIAAYTARVQRLWPDGIAFDDASGRLEPLVPLPLQTIALAALVQLRQSGSRRALAAVATGMGKTWLAALDVLQIGKDLQRRPRILIIAHRAQILAQAEVAITSLLEGEFGPADVSWYLGSEQDFSGTLVLASVQKLCRPAGLALLETTRFDYAILDEVHHAQAPTWRRVLASLQADFVLGLTATPERADGVDVATLFDDNLACLASIGDGIEEESLVPFHYIGLADTIEYSQIPWRSGRFDSAELERAVMTSARMERLWLAMQEHSGTRTIFFCCSRRHATFTRDWLRRHGLTAAAVFSGSGSDPLGDSLEAFRDGTLTSLCAVDLFNEGLDIPAVDRIV